MATHGRVLYVDAFDSFSNNVVGLLEQHLGVEVKSRKINDVEANTNFLKVIEDVDAIVIGPGPGHPSIPSDVGFINQIFSLPADKVLPVFGICLGFQSIGLNHGATVNKLPSPRHGLVTRVDHVGRDIFHDIDYELWCTQYHSLRVNLPENSELEPLAWDNNQPENGPILMGLRHTTKPYWGVQFHPESICTNAEGKRLIDNWWTSAQSWLQARRRASVATLPPVVDVTLTGQVQAALAGADPTLSWAEVPASEYVDAVSLTERLGLTQKDIITLDSQQHPTGRYSILGLIIPDKTVTLTYKAWEKTLSYGSNARNQQTSKLNKIEDLWPMLRDTLNSYNPHNNTKQINGTSGSYKDIPFWGGFMGYITYEAGLETINVQLHPSVANTVIPDINFAFIQRSIVIDHFENKAYVQSLLPGDEAWINETSAAISEVSANQPVDTTANIEAAAALESGLVDATFQHPVEAEYRNAVHECQKWMRTGDSYELCLTDETKITIPRRGNDAQAIPWTMYKKLRKLNKAPHGAFMRLNGALVVGSSPERFVSWSRGGHCQFRPIKGTVKKTADMTREKAFEILNTSKERAENLMIVDLIRHDLGGVIGAENVNVPKLMVVEEYQTVFQLVSVIEGQFAAANPDKASSKGIDILAASLPPGSMTGAPKKRSCEILSDMEARPRGIYSGVLGYMDVGGAGDFSVVIRTAFSNDSYADANRTEDTWRIGAGGAVTIQSTDIGEYLEMETKVAAPLQAFKPLVA